MISMPDDFNAFFASVGSNVSKASKSLAAEHDLSVLASTIAPDHLKIKLYFLNKS